MFIPIFQVSPLKLLDTPRFIYNSVSDLFLDTWLTFWYLGRAHKRRQRLFKDGYCNWKQFYQWSAIADMIISTHHIYIYRTVSFRQHHFSMFAFPLCVKYFFAIIPVAQHASDLLTLRTYMKEFQLIVLKWSITTFTALLGILILASYLSAFAVKGTPSSSGACFKDVSYCGEISSFIQLSHSLSVV